MVTVGGSSGKREKRLEIKSPRRKCPVKKVKIDEYKNIKIQNVSIIVKTYRDKMKKYYDNNNNIISSTYFDFSKQYIYLI